MTTEADDVLHPIPHTYTLTPVYRLSLQLFFCITQPTLPRLLCVTYPSMYVDCTVVLYTMSMIIRVYMCNCPEMFGTGKLCVVAEDVDEQ